MSISSSPTPVNVTVSPLHGRTLALKHAHTLGITHAEWVLISHIWSFQWDERLPYPRVALLAERMGTTEREVQHLLAALKRKGFLTVVPRYHGPFNGYDLSPLVLAAEGLERLEDDTPNGEAPPHPGGDTSQQPRGEAPSRPSGEARRHHQGEARLRPEIIKEKQVLEVGLTPLPPMAHDQDRQAIAETVGQVVDQLGGELTTSQVTRAVNVFHRAGIPLLVFRTLLIEALRTTRAQQAKGRQIGSPVAYYFRVLDGVVTQEQQDDALRSPQSDEHELIKPPPPPTTEWGHICAQIATTMTPANYQRWFATTRELEQASDVLTVAVPDAFHQQWLDTRLRWQIERELPAGRRVAFVVQPVDVGV